MNLNHGLLHARSLTERQYPFRIVFVKSGESGRDAIKVIEKCILRKSDPRDRNRDFKLYLFDVDTKENRSCWIPLIREIDGHKIEFDQ